MSGPAVLKHLLLPHSGESKLLQLNEEQTNTLPKEQDRHHSDTEFTSEIPFSFLVTE